MLFWILIALLTFVTVLLIVAPLLRAATGSESPAHNAHLQELLAQYRQFEQDREVGLIPAHEADNMDRELKRAILNAEQSSAEGQQHCAKRSVYLVRMLVILIPLSALFVYFSVGRPDMAERFSPPPLPQDLPMQRMQDTMLQGAENYLAENPQDRDMWSRLIGAYIRLGEREKAEALLNRAQTIFTGDEAALQALQQDYERALSSPSSSETEGAEQP
jgi:cytochrome c-type biogenesis protein CcmI